MCPCSSRALSSVATIHQAQLSKPESSDGVRAMTPTSWSHTQTNVDCWRILLAGTAKKKEDHPHGGS